VRGGKNGGNAANRRRRLARARGGKSDYKLIKRREFRKEPFRGEAKAMMKSVHHRKKASTFCPGLEKRLELRKRTFN